MNRRVIEIVVSVLALVCTAQAKAKVKSPNKLEVEVSLQSRFGDIASTGSAGLVVIDTITINRVQPEASGEPVSIPPELFDTQLGFATYGSRSRAGYQIVLKGSRLSDLMRESVSLGFNQAGYGVVNAGTPEAVAASHVDIEVTELWMWATPTEKSGRFSFHYSLSVSVNSDDPALASVGTVPLGSFRNGTRWKNPVSYLNTIVHTSKLYFNEFSEHVYDSRNAARNRTSSAAVGFELKGIADALTELESLRESGAISDEEFQQLKEKALGAIN